ncbi:hypothetical protein BVRB_1g021830 [Beta vulgaris subsp. vulgaris]|uniref:Uncharacterized protein n=1 Tax=Beta vulgaris subsp. vulgaris TaxID=3555 RepID=A0A0J8BHW0_BETVV|nr:hypothetical protein BVRB_1g021830 [Beta vulgaris subsp. vulgaris]
MAYSLGPYEHVTYSSSVSLEQSLQIGKDNQGNGESDPSSINTYVDIGDLSSNANQYGFCVNRQGKCLALVLKLSTFDMFS